NHPELAVFGRSLVPAEPAVHPSTSARNLAGSSSLHRSMVHKALAAASKRLSRSSASDERMPRTSRLLSALTAASTALACAPMLTLVIETPKDPRGASESWRR